MDAASKTEEVDQAKRAAAKKLIERYYYQLTQGCGKPACDNEHCASSGKSRKLTANQAAAQALVLFTRRAKLCDIEASRLTTNDDEQDEAMETTSPDLPKSSTSSHLLSDTTSSLDTSAILSTPMSDSTSLPVPNPIPGTLNELALRELIKSCQTSENFAPLVRTVGQVFSQRDLLSQSFLKDKPAPNHPAYATPTDDMSKEDVNAMQADLDKDNDSLELVDPHHPSLSPCPQVAPENPSSVDIESLRRSYEALLQVPASVYQSALVHALVSLCESAELELKFAGDSTWQYGSGFLNVFIIAFEFPALGAADYLESVLPALCKATALLPLAQQARLANFWAENDAQHLFRLVQTLQQLISVKVLSGNYARSFPINDDETVTAAVKVLRLLYNANIRAGYSFMGLEPGKQKEMEDSTLAESSDDLQDFFPHHASSAASRNDEDSSHEDLLAAELGISVLDCRQAPVAFAEFYNEPLSEIIAMDQDFAYFKSSNGEGKGTFSFMNYPFVLTPAAKSWGLYYDNRIRMYSERRLSLYHSVVHGQLRHPYLKLKIRRDHVIDDALMELEMIALENPMDLKKQLVVEFDGEQGIDEGGVSNEFFQLVVDQIFNPDYAMFTFREETQTYWFNPTSFETDAQFTLVGIMIGLAIYNTVTLDVRFPMVVYRKLMGRKGLFEDLQDFDPSLWKGLQELLDYNGSDIEDTYMQTFRLSYSDVFGTTYTHDLKPGGESIPVTEENRKEFVELYADFLLNKSTARQFRAFKRGFDMVTEDSLIGLLFRPEEIEQLVCGSKEYDFHALESSTEYEGGFTSDSPTIKHFWEILHSLSLEEQRQFLQFTTGSDRVPVGGLGKLKLMISRNGSDSQRLPTAHTCFNYLFLPDYESKEKLRDRLLKAISYSKGFGIL